MQSARAKCGLTQTSFPVKPPENGGEPKYYTVRFLNGDTVLQESLVAEGEMPVFEGENPTPEVDYAFDGWLPELAPVTGNVDYVAQFKYTKSITRALVDRSITTYSNDTITSVREGAFRNCLALQTVSVPNVTEIKGSAAGCGAFDGCINLTNINMTSVKTLGQFAFRDCENLIAANIPNVINMNENNIFLNTTALANVTLPATPPTIKTTTFNKINPACVFHIPAGSLSAYQSATNWSTLTGQYTFTEDA